MPVEKPKSPVPVVISPEDKARLMSEVSAAAAKQAAKFVTPKEAKGDTGRVPSVDAVPLLGDKTAKNMQDDWIRRMMSDCEGKPELADTLRELSGLLRADADDATLQLLEQDIRAIQKKNKDDSAGIPTSGGVNLIKRVVNIPPVSAGSAVTGVAGVKTTKVSFKVIPDTSTPGVSGKDDMTGKTTGRRRGISHAAIPDGSGTEKEPDNRLATLLAEISNGGTFVLVSARGSRMEYKRDGDDFVNKKGDVAMGDIVKKLDKGWMVEEPADTAVVTPASIEAKKEFELPDIGSEVSYRDEFGEVIKVIRVSDDHYSVILTAGDAAVDWNADILKGMAKTGKWELISQTPVVASVEVVTPVEVVAPVSEPIVPSVESPKKSSIEELRTGVGEMRLEYVTIAYNQKSTWARLRRFFGANISPQPSDDDTRFSRERYERKLNELREAELAELRTGVFSSDAEMRERVGGMLKYYEVDEQNALMKTRDQVKIESKNLGQRAISAVENLGRKYNELSRFKKYTIAAACGAGAIGAGFVGGGAVLAAGGVALIRRSLGTAGLAVAVDTYLETREEKKRLGAFETVKEQRLDRLSEVMSEQGDYISTLDQLLKDNIASLDARVQAQSRQILLRRTLSWSAASVAIAGGSWAASYVREVFHHEDIGIDKKQDEFLRSRESSGKVGLNPAAAAPEQAASAPAHAASAPSGTASQPSGIDAKPAVPAASPDTAPVRGSGLLKEYTVTTADGKKGLWGILERRLDGVPEADQDRVIASLENIMRQKLDAMTPAERSAAGFPKSVDGKVNLDFIKPKTTIDFGKLLTQQEIQSVLDGQSVGAPSGVVDTAHISPANQDAFDAKISKIDYESNVVQYPMGAAHEAAVANYDTIGNIRDYLSAHPEKLPDVRVSLGHFREEIFLTGDVQKIMDQDYNKYLSLTSPELGKLGVTQVLRDYQLLKENPFAEYDRDRNPLHFSQMQQIDRLLTASGKAYGALGSQIPAGATIDDLTKRLTTIGYQQNNDIPQFLKIKS